MVLGVCCQWLEPYAKRDGSIEYVNSINERTLQLGRFRKGEYSSNYIRDVYHNNVQEIIKLVPKLKLNNIKSFRLSSNIFSLFEFNEQLIYEDEVLIKLLDKLGKLFLEANIRVTTHPGQFTVLSSDSPITVQNSIRELSNHAWVFDKMGLPISRHAAINIHGGKGNRVDQLTAVVRDLPDNIRLRLTLENDERAYSLIDLLPVYEATGVSICWDSHHHIFNDGNLSLEEACGLALYTWNNSDCKPLQHLSNTIPGMENGSYTERRKHSDYIKYIPECQRELLVKDKIDVDVEAKMKNLAVAKLKQLLSEKSI